MPHFGKGNSKSNTRLKRTRYQAYRVFPLVILTLFAEVLGLGLSTIESEAAKNSLPFLEESVDTTITSPHGGAITGNTSLIMGTAFSYTGVVGVTVQIQRLTDGANWDGSRWRMRSSWLNAQITSGDKQATASWRLLWKVPEGDRDTSYIIQALGRDATNAIEPTPAVVQVTIDNQRPVIRAIRPAGANPGFTNSRSQLLLLNVLGASQVRWALSPSELKAADYSRYTSRVRVAMPDGNGARTIYWQFRDDAGNETKPGSPGSRTRIVLDRVAPGGKMAVNNGYANTSDLFVYVTNKPDENRSSIHQMRFSNNGKKWSAWERFIPVKSGWDLTSKNFGGSTEPGMKTVYAQYRDKAGNTSRVFADAIDLAPQQLTQPHGIAVPDNVAGQAAGAQVEVSEAKSIKAAPERQGLAAEDLVDGFSEDTSYCLLCHDLHGGPATSYSSQGRPFQKTDKWTLLAEAREKAVCYTCHNGTASVSNTQNDFGDDGSETSTRVSVHPVNDATLLCSDCHTPHMEPENEDADNRDNEVYRLLRVRYPTYFAYLLSPLNTGWEDTTGDADNPGARRMNSPNDFCGGCHGTGSELPGGDLVSDFVGTEHDTGVTGPASGTGIKCNRCHEWHGSDIAPMLQQTIDAQVVTGNNDSLCYACHAPAEGSYPGESIFQQTKHYAVQSSTAATPTWPDTSYGAGWCHNCHNEHGSPYQQDRRADKNSLCYVCHDNESSTPPATYTYRGRDLYEATPHFTESSTADVFPVTGDAGESQSAGECTNCHATMGRDDGEGAPLAKLMRNKEEITCFGGSYGGACHSLAYTYDSTIDAFYSLTGSKTADAAEEFSPILRFIGLSAGTGATVDSLHDISDVDQEITNPGAKVECTSCHNSHTNNQDYDFAATSRISNPDNINRNWTERYLISNTFPDAGTYYETLLDRNPTFGKTVPDFVGFCLRCHDNSLPSGVSFGPTATLNIAADWVTLDIASADQHGRANGQGGSQGTLKLPYIEGGDPYAAMQCSDCHEKHGESGNLYALKSRVFVNGTQMSTDAEAYVVSVSDNTYGGGLTGFCSFCHDLSSHDPETTCDNCHLHGTRF